MDVTGQMTIFDFLPQPEDDLETLPEEEMVKRIGEAVGLVFKVVKYDSKYERYNNIPNKEYESKLSKHERYTLQYLTYMDTNRLFISVGCCYKTSGCGAPCDSIQEAIEYLKYGIAHMQQEKERLKKEAEQEREYRKKYNLDY